MQQVVAAWFSNYYLNQNITASVQSSPTQVRYWSTRSELSGYVCFHPFPLYRPLHPTPRKCQNQYKASFWRYISMVTYNYYY
jgi:hypothetical protein